MILLIPIGIKRTVIFLVEIEKCKLQAKKRGLDTDRNRLNPLVVQSDTCLLPMK